MTKKAQKKGGDDKPQITEQESVTVQLSRQPEFKKFAVWLVGDTPLITHAWSEKARREMLEKQVKATRGGKTARDPEADYKSSLYEMGDDQYGFPTMGIKNCVLSAAHKDKGLPRTQLQAALWLDSEMVRTRPALAGAVCDMPLTRIWGTDPEMREDMVRIGSGMSKTATLAYRGQFTVWAMKISGELNTSIVSADALAFIIQDAGRSYGLGEWRNEKKGIFGSFHLGNPKEAEEWDRFAAGAGEMPIPDAYADAELIAAE